MRQSADAPRHHNSALCSETNQHSINLLCYICHKPGTITSRIVCVFCAGLLALSLSHWTIKMNKAIRSKQTYVLQSILFPVILLDNSYCGICCTNNRLIFQASCPIIGIITDQIEIPNASHYAWSQHNYKHSPTLCKSELYRSAWLSSCIR